MLQINTICKKIMQQIHRSGDPKLYLVNVVNSNILLRMEIIPHRHGTNIYIHGLILITNRINRNDYFVIFALGFLIF